MRKLVTAAALLASLALPAVAPAKPTKSEKKSAAKECKAERKAMGKEAFREKYGTNKNRKNAFGKCVSKTAREEEKENDAAAKNASKECKAERETLGDEAFAAKYGTNKNGKNAHGKCVSSKAKENKAEADKKEKETAVNAAQACRTEQCQNEEEFKAAHGGKTFSEFYGTNENDKNAFGKCVSSKSKPQPQPTSG